MNPWEGFALAFAITAGICFAIAVVLVVLYRVGAFDDPGEPEFFDEEDTRPYPTRENEDALEAAYWNFDTRRAGNGAWEGRPQAERDAFKAAVRGMHAPFDADTENAS